MMHFDEEKVVKLIKELSKRIIIVEGLKDEKALKQLVKTQLIRCNANPNSVSSKIKGKEVVILTDFDEEGENLFKKIKTNLQANKIKVNESLRREFYNIFKIVKIEELTSLVKRNKQLYDILVRLELEHFLQRKSL